MKKLFLLISFIFLLGFITPKPAHAEGNPCVMKYITCADGTTYSALCCDQGDLLGWIDLCCGVTVD